MAAEGLTMHGDFKDFAGKSISQRTIQAFVETSKNPWSWH